MRLGSFAGLLLAARAIQWAIVVALATGIGGLLPFGAAHRRQDALVEQHSTPPEAGAGSFRLMVYNVAGLPRWLSDAYWGQRPARARSQIAERLSGYDLVLLQEDFVRHEALVRGTGHPYRSRHVAPTLGLFAGDGLARLSRFEFDHVVREKWKKCSGVIDDQLDCWAAKGFSFARHTVAAGTSIDVYNIHLDAGSSKQAKKTKHRQLQQLIDRIEERSRGRAVIVGGDANFIRIAESSKELVRRAGLRDACARLDCGHTLPDRVFYRSGRDVEIEPEQWQLARARFSDGDGRPLSDHDPVVVTLRWRRKDVRATLARAD